MAPGPPAGLRAVKIHALDEHPADRQSAPTQACLAPGPWTRPATFAVVGAADASPIELFVPEGCPPCGRAKTVMGQLGRERPELPIVVRDVQQDPAAMARLQ